MTGNPDERALKDHDFLSATAKALARNPQPQAVRAAMQAISDDRNARIDREARLVELLRKAVDHEYDPESETCATCKAIRAELGASHE